MSDPTMYSPRYETMSRDELTQLQLERLQASINRAYKNVAFYRRRMDEIGMQPEDIQSIEDLRALPFTTKEDLRGSYPYDMVAVPLREVVRFHLSSGTTGSPTVIAYTANDLQHWTALVARNLVAGGINREDVVQVFFGYGLFSGGFGLHQGAEAVGASVVPVSAVEMSLQVKIMQDFRSTALVGMPSYALAIAHEMETQGMDPNALSLRVGIFGAEPWSEKTRQEIEERLYIKAFDIYGLSEMGGPGVSGECSERNGLHIAEDHFLVEVVDPADGTPVAPGEEGELVFTTLAREALPLFRYRSGDISQVDAALCPCGRTQSRMARVLRRTDDMVIIHGVNVFPDDVAEVLRDFREVSDAFILVVERAGGVEKLEIKVELADFPSDISHGVLHLRDTIAGRLERVLGFDVKVVLLEPRSLHVNGEKPLRVDDRRGG